MGHLCEGCGHALPNDTGTYCPECGEPRPVPIQLHDLENEMQAERWREVIQHGIVMEARWDEVTPGYLVLVLDEDDAKLWGIYTHLYVDLGGRIAEAMVNHPYYYMTFSQLLQAAAARTAAS